MVLFPLLFPTTDDSRSYVHGDEPRRADTRNSSPTHAETSIRLRRSSATVALSGSRCIDRKLDVTKYSLSQDCAPKPKVRQVEAELPKVNEISATEVEWQTNQPAKPREAVENLG